MSPSNSCFLSQCISSTAFKENQGSFWPFSLLSQKRVNKSTSEALHPVIAPGSLPGFLQASAQTCSGRREATRPNLTTPARPCPSPPPPLFLYTCLPHSPWSGSWKDPPPSPKAKPLPTPSVATTQLELAPNSPSPATFLIWRLPHHCSPISEFPLQILPGSCSPCASHSLPPLCSRREHRNVPSGVSRGRATAVFLVVGSSFHIFYDCQVLHLGFSQ